MWEEYEEILKIGMRGSRALDAYADETKQSVLEGKLLWSRMINRAWNDKKFAAKVSAWVERPSTIILRDLAKEVGYSYWEDLSAANAVNKLDAASARFIDGSSTA